MCVPSALGYQEASDLELKLKVFVSHYVGTESGASARATTQGLLLSGHKILPSKILELGNFKEKVGKLTACWPCPISPHDLIMCEFHKRFILFCGDIVKSICLS